MNKTVQSMQETIFHGRSPDCPATEAIREAVEVLLREQVCTEAEFMALIDLDQKDTWFAVANSIASRLEPLFRRGVVHPNAVKPWQRCPNFKQEFERVAHIRAWRSAHGAINSILAAVNRLYER